MKQPTRTKVIFALANKNGLLNKELIKRAKTNHNSLAKVLKVLQKEEIIVKDKENRYWFSTNLENKMLQTLGSASTEVYYFGNFMDNLKNSERPFQKSSDKIGDMIKLLVILKIERYATPKLTKRDKLEFDLYFDLIENELKEIFDFLKKKDKKKTNDLRLAMLSSFKEKKNNIKYR